ncbi:DUF4142 domain-containing protein [Pantoea sp. Mb-10]|uniref:DUF4142 domain-containing protein n=1 Tax=unclassified Pantoea TaxID=2630326 RepID=UPI001E2824CA|nr:MULTISPECIES: DUF4142 domain-containing protein [unclassified Pantoea]MCE0491923.1 DUF4142 domain-containing protein [Pantoea sp. Mb-10]MCE0503340.1 DUF4142 domain-containing protein [Pantoea sp. Pb-8]
MQKSHTLKGLLAVSVVAVLVNAASVQAQAPASGAQPATANQSGSGAPLSAGDQKAMKDMAQANINEIAAAKIALSKAQSSNVKAFAQKMVDDHSAALTKVQTVAQQKGVTLPTEPDSKHKAMAAKLEKQSGSAFDKLYMENAGTKDHKMVLSTLKKDASKITDPDVKALAEAHTPVVEQHLKSAQDMSM